MSKVYKIVLTGDGGVGKTTMVNRHKTGEFVDRYFPTAGVVVTPLKFNTSDGIYTLNIWDVVSAPDDQKFFDGADGFIVMFDITNHHSYIHAFNDATYAKETGKPMVICGNKCDISNDPSAMKLDIGTRFGCPFWLTSAKSNYNFEKPFLKIIQMISGKPDIVFTETPI